MLRIRIQCFWAFRIRLSNVRIRILLSSSKKNKKNLDPTVFWLISLWLFILESVVDVASKSNKQKNLEEKKILRSFQIRKSAVRSGSGSATLLWTNSCFLGQWWLIYYEAIRKRKWSFRCRKRRVGQSQMWRMENVWVTGRPSPRFVTPPPPLAPHTGALGHKKSALTSCINFIVPLSNSVADPDPYDRMFLGLLAPDPLVRGRIRIQILLSSSKKNLEKPWFLPFCDFFMTFYLWKMM